MALTTSGPAEPEPRETVAGRPGRALADRAVDTLREQSAASQRGRPRQNRRLHPANGDGRMPVLVDEQGVLIAGHARVGAAARLGLKSIPVIVARGWSEEEKRAYRLADNQLAARASWDPDLLRNELRELKFSRFRPRSDRLRAGSARRHPGRVGIERSDRSRQRPGSTRSTRSLGSATCGCWETIGSAAATAPARRMSRQCWRERSLT